MCRRQETGRLKCRARWSEEDGEGTFSRNSIGFRVPHVVGVEDGGNKRGHRDCRDDRLCGHRPCDDVEGAEDNLKPHRQEYRDLTERDVAQRERSTGEGVFGHERRKGQGKNRQSDRETTTRLTAAATANATIIPWRTCSRESFPCWITLLGPRSSAESMSRT